MAKTYYVNATQILKRFNSITIFGWSKDPSALTKRQKQTQLSSSFGLSKHKPTSALFFSSSLVCQRFKQQKQDGRRSASGTNMYRMQRCSTGSHLSLCSDDDWVRSLSLRKCSFRQLLISSKQNNN